MNKIPIYIFVDRDRYIDRDIDIDDWYKYI